jgi:hypothetical protein
LRPTGCTAEKHIALSTANRPPLRRGHAVVAAAMDFKRRRILSPLRWAKICLAQFKFFYRFLPSLPAA